MGINIIIIHSRGGIHMQPIQNAIITHKQILNFKYGMDIFFYITMPLREKSTLRFGLVTTKH